MTQTSKEKAIEHLNKSHMTDNTVMFQQVETSFFTDDIEKALDIAIQSEQEKTKQIIDSRIKEVAFNLANFEDTIESRRKNKSDRLIIKGHEILINELKELKQKLGVK